MLPASMVAHRSSAFAPLLTTTGPGRRPGPAVWCPTMDLLALSTADGRLSVRRLDWTRLWSARVVGNANASPSSSAKPAAAAAAAAPSTSSSAAAASASVTALAWRPDGRALAVASSCGGLEVRATEDGEVLASLSGGASSSSSRPPPPSPPRFVALSWATDGGGGAAAGSGLSLRDSLVASGPPLPPCPLPAPEEFEERREAEAAEAAEEAEEAAAAADGRSSARPPRHEPSSLQVLAAADSSGVVHLFGPGLVPLARLPVAGAAAAKRGRGKDEQTTGGGGRGRRGRDPGRRALDGARLPPRPPGPFFP